MALERGRLRAGRLDEDQPTCLQRRALRDIGHEPARGRVGGDVDQALVARVRGQNAGDLREERRL